MIVVRTLVGAIDFRALVHARQKDRLDEGGVSHGNATMLTESVKLVTSREAVDFLSQAAPRPWVQRLLRWMAFDAELTAFSTKGIVQAHTTVGALTMSLLKEAGEPSGAKMDAAIRSEFSPEMAEQLLGKQPHDRVNDEPVEWDDSEDPRQLDPGFFLYAAEIDWDNGKMKVDYLDRDYSLGEAIFPSEDLFYTDFERPEYEAEIEGLSFDFGAVELLLPHMQFRPSDSFMADNNDRKRRIGRPPKWDWEGAMAFIVSLAQTPDGLPTGPGAQARIEELIAGWFEEEGGDSPAPSQVRQRAAIIIRNLERPKRPESH